MATPQNYTVGRGRLEFAPFKAGTTRPSAFRYLGHTTEMSISATAEKLDHWNMDGGPKTKDRSVTLSVDYSMTFTTDHISPENVALFFMSEGPQTVTQAAAASLEETITGVVLERKYMLGESAATPNGVKNATITTVTVGGTELEAEIDYVADLVNGTIFFREDAGVTAGANVTIAYAVEASTFSRVISGNQAVRGVLRFVSDNAAGDDFTMLFPSVEITPNGDYALKGDEWQVLGFNGSIEKLEDRAAIYRDGHPARIQ